MKKTFFNREYDVIDLSHLGINNFAFDLISSIQFMYDAISNGYRILGGDIITDINGQLELSIDNWYSQSKDPQETFFCALDYLKKYVQYNSLINWKVAVVTSNQE